MNGAPIYKLVVGEQKDVNANLNQPGVNWKPILMTAIPDALVPNGIKFAVILERS